MNTKDLTLSQTEIHKLLCAGSGDAVLLHLYLQCGNSLQEAETALGMGQARYSCAAATLRQLGLWPEESALLRPAHQPPQYTEEDVTQAMNHSDEFRLLVGEVQRTLGRILTTEELKILLSFRNYLDLPAEVVSMLVCYCKERMRRRGSNRNPSLRMIEKEAYIWAEQGINTLEEAAEIVDRIGWEEIRLVADFYNLEYVGEADADLSCFLPLLFHVHISDDEGSPDRRSCLKPERRSIHQTRIRHLYGQGYCGAVTLETDTPAEEKKVEQSLLIIRRAAFEGESIQEGK